MWINLQYFLINFFVLCVFGQGIRNIYLDRSTQLFKYSTGIVIVELSDGKKGTICMNSIQDNLNAQVICRMLNYINSSSPAPLSAVGFISSLKTTIAPTYFNSISCNGNENSLSTCPGFSNPPTVPFRCRNNNQDLSVYCLLGYQSQKNTETYSDLSKVSLTNDMQKLLISKVGQNIYFFCGSKNIFGINEAKLFCRLLSQNDSNARIVQGINMTGLTVPLTVGGFNKMTCNANALTLADCINANMFDSDGCMPTDNIGVSCDIDAVKPVDLPTVICERNTLTLQWNLSSTQIRAEDVFIMYKNVICTSVTKINDSKVLNLTVSLNDCNDDATGDSENVIFTFSANRTFPRVNGYIVQNEQLFTPKCYIRRNDTVIHGPFSLKSGSIPVGTNSTVVPVILELFLDISFKTPVQSLISQPIGTVIFVRVRMENPPYQLALVLLNCFVVSDSSQVQLISNRCPLNDHKVQINLISSSVVSFNFQSFSIPGATRLRVTCETSKCGINEIGCLRSC